MSNIKKPYETTAGSLIDTNAIIKKVNEFITLTQVGDSIAYEFYQGDVGMYIITGKNDKEKELPLFDFPLFFKDVRGKSSIAIDLRPYVNSTLIKEPFDKLETVMRDKYSANFVIFIALLANRLDIDVNDIKPIQNNIITAFVAIMSNALNRVMPLDPISRTRIDLAIGLYAYTLIYPNKNYLDDIVRVSNTLGNCKLTLTAEKNTIGKVIEELLTKVDSTKQGNITYLMDLFKVALPEDLHDVINVDAIYTSLSNGWFGPGNTTAIYISFESISVFISLVYSCINSRMFMKSKVGTIINDNKRKIDIAHIDNYITNILLKKELGNLL